LSIIERVLRDYLRKDELQRLARNLGLPVTRDKDEIVGELLAASDFDPSDAVWLLSSWQLRQLCADLDIPAGAYKEDLRARVNTAIKKDAQPVSTPLRRRRVSRVQSAFPAPAESATTIGQTKQSVKVNVAPPPPPTIEVNVQPSPPNPIEVQVHSPKPSALVVEVHNPPAEVHVKESPATAWGFVGVAAAVVCGGVFLILIGYLGTTFGVLVGIVAGLGVAVTLLVTEKAWAPRLNRWARSRHAK
jgi:hypothetical protein